MEHDKSIASIMCKILHFSLASEACSAAGKKQIDIWSLFLIKGVLLVMLFDSYILGLTALNQLNSH